MKRGTGFIDADKPAYIEYFNLFFAQPSKNGFILADNIFFMAKVLDRGGEREKCKRHKAFNEFIKNRKDMKKYITLRDGCT